MDDGQIQNLNRGQHNLVRLSEVDFGVVEHVENALRGGKVVRARFLLGNEARQLRQIVAQKVADAERVNRRERGVDHVRGAALVVRADAGFQ